MPDFLEFQYSQKQKFMNEKPWKKFLWFQKNIFLVQALIYVRVIRLINV